jgi:hypothetical protein
VRFINPNSGKPNPCKHRLRNGLSVVFRLGDNHHAGDFELVERERKPAAFDKQFVSLAIA